MDAIETRFNFSVDRLPKHPISKHRDYQRNHENAFGSLSRENLVGKIDFFEDIVIKTEKNKCMADLTVPISARNATIDNRNFGYA